MLMLLHVPAPLVAMLSVFVILTLHSSRAERHARSWPLVSAWALVGAASATVWVLWWGKDTAELPEPAYLSVLGNTTTLLAAGVTVLTLVRVLRRAT